MRSLWTEAKAWFCATSGTRNQAVAFIGKDLSQKIILYPLSAKKVTTCQQKNTITKYQEKLELFNQHKGFWSKALSK
jgi:hypothetical protein